MKPLKSASVIFIGLFTGFLSLIPGLLLSKIWPVLVLIGVLPLLLSRLLYSKGYLRELELVYGSSIVFQVLLFSSVGFFPQFYSNLSQRAFMLFVNGDLEGGIIPNLDSVPALETVFVTAAIFCLVYAYRESLFNNLKKKLQ